MELGVAQLDALLAPFPEQSGTVLVNDPGIEAEPFLYQILQRQTTEGRDVVYVLTGRHEDALLDDLETYDLDVDTDRLFIVDAFTSRRGFESEADYDVRDTSSVEGLVELLSQAARDHPDAVLLVEDLSLVLDADDLAGQARLLEGVLDRFLSTVVLLTRWPYEVPLDGLLSVFGAEVALRAVEGKVILSQYFEVVRADWRQEVDTHPRLYKPIRPGGIYVYVPKIAVTGPYNAGKSTFVRSVSDRSVSVDRLGTTVALDHGHVRIDGIAADLFGTPGQARFDPILETLSGRGLGLLLMVDSTKPESFPRAGAMLDKTWRYGLPTLIVANKQDLPEALTPDQIRQRMSLPPDLEIIECVAEEPESARWVLRQLLDRILRSGVMAREGWQTA